jgi:copper chaperone CopZ
MNRAWLAPTLLVLAAGVLGTIALRAGERDYVVPAKPVPASIPLALEGAAPEGFALRTLAVEGICCQGCSSKLFGALLAVDGVQAAAVDPLQAEASAGVRPDVPVAALEAALTFDKYTARAR